jgi:uncharacterized membrane protein
MLRSRSGSRWRRHSDERGATFVLTALCMVLLLWGGAMGVDIGFTVAGSRQAQAMADTAALDTARYINLADNVKQNNYTTYLNGLLSNVKSDNGGSNVALSVTGGYWTNGVWSLPPAGGACYHQNPQNNPPCTAVMVTATQSVPRIFAGGNGSVTRTSIATITPEDGFSIGTYLATMNSQQSGVLNAILSTLGTSVSLTAVGYAGLANSFVSVQQLISASGGVLTPNNVLSTSLSASQWLAFLTTALQTQQTSLSCGATPTPSACAGYTALSALDFNGSASARLCDLVTINGSSCLGGNLSIAGLSARINVLQTLTTEAELSNGQSAINVQSALSMPGVSNATISLNLIQPPQVAYGPVGATAKTAQVTADLQLTVSGAGTLDIPVTAATGTGTLTTMTCSVQNNAFSRAIVTAATTTATAALSLNNSSIGSLSLGGAANTPLQFNSTTPIPPTAASAQSVPPTNPLQLGTQAPTPTYSGLPGLLNPLVATVLNTTLPGVLAPILQAAGISVGGANVADLGYNCGAVSIVQ